MRRFTELYVRLDRTTRTSEKLAALRDFFAAADPADAAHALALLVGRRPRRAVSHTELRTLVAERAGLPLWLVGECYDAVGDLSETLSLLLPDPPEPFDEPLRETVEERLAPLAAASPEKRRDILSRAWDEFDRDQRLVFHKLISGSFRVGVQRKLVVRALAEHAGLEPAVLEHRVAGRWKPTAADFRALLDPDAADADPHAPYPFFLASQLDHPPDKLGDPAEWRAEHKWDGMRAQLLRRPDATLLWTRGEELVTDAFPEIAAAAAKLPPGSALDGELLAFEHGAPLPFARLQRRLNRTSSDLMLFPEHPVVFMAYDALEAGGDDLRERPIEDRRAALEELVAGLGAAERETIRVSPLVPFGAWPELARERDRSRERGVEGIMLKRAGSPYRAGRTRGDWWKWKIDPFTIDAVLVAAQRGHGRRASLYTDYTFALRDDRPDADPGSLVRVTKAYSGLDDDEFDRVDAFIRAHTTAGRGPYREVEPKLVFEIAFEGVNRSDRNRSGYALRFPRMARRRTDKSVGDIDALSALRALVELAEAPREPTP